MDERKTRIIYSRQISLLLVVGNIHVSPCRVRLLLAVAVGFGYAVALCGSFEQALQNFMPFYFSVTIYLNTMIRLTSKTPLHHDTCLKLQLFFLY